MIYKTKCENCKNDYIRLNETIITDSKEYLFIKNS